MDYEHTQTRCCTCLHYINPRQRRLYPNCDNEALGWVTCGIGSTIKKTTMACGHYTDPDEEPAEPQKRSLIK
jgi:hypothetical protein